MTNLLTYRLYEKSCENETERQGDDSTLIKKKTQKKTIIQLRNLADPSSSIIGDFLVFDNHLITDKPVYRTSPMKRAPRAFRRSCHARRSTRDAAGDRRVKYDDRQQYTKLRRGRDANGKTDEMCPTNIENLSMRNRYYCFRYYYGQNQLYINKNN